MSPCDISLNTFNIDHFEQYIINNSFVIALEENVPVDMAISLDDIDDLLDELEMRGFHVMHEVPQVTNHLRYWYEQL